MAYERDAQWSETATILPAIVALTSWSFGSWPLLRRIWPAIAFLVFMLPLPQLVNNLLALPLQSVAATSSRFLLQLSGVWVIQEGNVINLSTSHGVERSCCTRLQWLANVDDHGRYRDSYHHADPPSSVEANHLASQYRAYCLGEQHGPNRGHRMVFLL